MRAMLIRLLLTIIVLIFIGCSETDTKGSGKTTTDPEHALNISSPDGRNVIQFKLAAGVGGKTGNT